VEFDAATGLLTIHVLDLADRQAWIDTIKGRYERRLREIFE
jgi:multicomponent K+:H+ antiporter subunit E